MKKNIAFLIFFILFAHKARSTHVVQCFGLNSFGNAGCEISEDGGRLVLSTQPGHRLLVQESVNGNQEGSRLTFSAALSNPFQIPQLPQYFAEYEDEKFEKRGLARGFQPGGGLGALLGGLGGLLGNNSGFGNQVGWGRALNQAQSAFTQGGFLPDLQQGVSPVFTLSEKSYDGDIGCGPGGSKESIVITNGVLKIKNDGFNHKAKSLSWDDAFLEGPGNKLTVTSPESGKVYKDVVLEWNGTWGKGISIKTTKDWSLGYPARPNPRMIMIQPSHEDVGCRITFNGQNDKVIFYQD